MKKVQVIKYLFIAILSSAVACTDYLDKDIKTDTSLSYEELFSDPRLAIGFLNNIYVNLREGYDPLGDGSMFAAACDEAVCSNPKAKIHAFNNGSLSDSYNPDDVWEHYYSGIRKCNIFIKELDGIIKESNSISASDREICRGEAIFLRAYFHFELLKRYQNIFWVEQVFDAFNMSEIYKLSQLSFQEVANKIANECDSAYKCLPKIRHSSDSKWNGRPIASAPKALKSRVLLYAASPLNNPTQDMDLWLKAEVAAQEFITEFKTIHPKQIYSNFNNSIGYGSEVIFASGPKASNSFERYNFPISYGGNGTINPTQNLVDCYSMRLSTNLTPLVGTPAATNTYNPEKPYAARRDLRFNAIVYDSLEYKVGNYVETFVGGKDGLGSSNQATKTGYYLQRFVTKSLDLSKNENQMHQWIYFRTSEIMLNYAEALCMRVGATSEVVNAIKDFRQMAGLQTFRSVNTYTKESMLEYIKNERRIELAFEDHRFWDLRRWKDAERVLNGPIYGMRITRKDNGTDADGNTLYKKEYEIFTVENRTFDPRMYWYPIPRREILKYKEAGVTLIQNPGY